MGSYTKYITNTGENMLTRATTDGGLKFTRVVISDIAISGTEEQIKAITQIADEKQIAIPAAATATSNTIRVQSSFTNEDVTESYLVQTVGLYAKTGDGPEELFCIAVAVDPSKMTVATTESTDTLEFNFNIAVQQADQITITVAPGGSLPSEVFYQMFPGMTAPNEEKAGDVLRVSAGGKWEYAKVDDEISETSENFVKNKAVAAALNKQSKKLAETFPGLPAPTTDDAGKTVMINGEGNAVWSQAGDIRDKIDNFKAVTIRKNSDGSIDEIDSAGNKKHTAREADGSITTTLYDANEVQIAQKTTRRNDDGSISVEVV